MTHHTTTSTRGQAIRLSHRLLAMVLATLSFVLLLGAGTASAIVVRPEIATFGPDGTNGSSFVDTGALAFEKGTHRLFVTADGTTPGIFGFDVSNSFPPPLLSGFSPLPTPPFNNESGLAVDNTALSSAGNLYYTPGLYGPNESTVYGFDKTGTPLGGNFPIDVTVSPGTVLLNPGIKDPPNPEVREVKELCNTAIDSAGNLWVASYGAASLLKYSSTGVFQESIGTTDRQIFPCNLAFDSNDDLYVGSGSDPTWKYTTASGYSVATEFDSDNSTAIAVDPTTHHVFIGHRGTPADITEFDEDGNVLSRFATEIPGVSSELPNAIFGGLAFDPDHDRLYASDGGNPNDGKIRVFGEALTYPDLTLGATSGIENTSATANGTISAQGLAVSDCHFEYVSEEAFNLGGFSDLSSGGSAPCSPSAGSIPVDSATHPVSATLGGLMANSAYRFRLVAANVNGSILTLSESFETGGQPLVETTGSPVRTTTTARLDSRVSPSRAAATYRFEYGDQGPCDANPCTSTESHPIAAGNEFLLVSQQIEGLEPDTTYHYRVVADNGNSDGPAIGEDMTLTTFADEAPLSHGQLPGPVGSDRAWEMVSAPDTSGNPVGTVFAPGADTISDAGDRAVYGVAGGTPDSEVGTIATRLFAQRTPTGWQTKQIYAPRDEATSDQWSSPGGPSDLSEMVTENYVRVGSGEFSFWRLSPDDPPQKLYGAPDNTTTKGGFFTVSEDASRVLATLKGSQDPNAPAAPNTQNLYDISGGSPKLISLLPDGTVPACGVIPSGFPNNSNRSARWVSTDGTFVFFPSSGPECGGADHLYVRNFEAETTKSISSPTVSGKECDTYFIKSIPGAAYLYTESRLAAEDREPSSCTGGDSNGDVYRYDLSDGSLDCLTCVLADRDARVTFSNSPAEIGNQIGIANDGSRVYFTSHHRLLPGAAGIGVYRLEVASDELAYVGSFGPLGEHGKSAMNASDGSIVVFSSDSASLNALGGQQNGGGLQYYLYDDSDRSLICVSCPADGSAPRGPVGTVSINEPGQGANTEPLDEDGGTFAFETPTALVSADQNTTPPAQKPDGGTDVYEWREGRLLMVSDGLTNWPGTQTPLVRGVTPSGKDIFFQAAAQYTKDALDGYMRLYDARIGGGFVIPPKPKPCPLEVCQGTPKGAPEEAAPGTASIAGAGNVKRSGRVVCAKPKRKVRKSGKTRCVKPKPARGKANRQRASHDRRTAR